MKRIKSNYHALKLLKTAQPKLRKAIISNCNQELLNCISECILNVLNGNLCQTALNKSYESIKQYFARSLISASPSAMKRLINQRRGFLLPLLSAVLPTLTNLLFGPRAKYICYEKCISFHLISFIIHRNLHQMRRRRRVENCLLKIHDK